MSEAPTEPVSSGFRDLALPLRGRAGVAQRELAARAGVSERAVQTWEARRSYPSARSLRAMIGPFLARGAFATGRERQEAAAGGRRVGRAGTVPAVWAGPDVRHRTNLHESARPSATWNSRRRGSRAT
jgi:hypothetical protein